MNDIKNNSIGQRILTDRFGRKMNLNVRITDIEITDPDKGLILRSDSTGQRKRVGVLDDGDLTTETPS
jgi:hypothetical protein